MDERRDLNPFHSTRSFIVFINFTIGDSQDADFSAYWDQSSTRFLIFRHLILRFYSHNAKRSRNTITPGKFVYCVKCISSTDYYQSVAWKAGKAPSAVVADCYNKILLSLEIRTKMLPTEFNSKRTELRKSRRHYWNLSSTLRAIFAVEDEMIGSMRIYCVDETRRSNWTCNVALRSNFGASRYWRRMDHDRHTIPMF
ncbi:hypothetical protein L5515_003298 [Caenorhabditis briggsae]|uniref:Uncharacterized protein n=1 Tax=Caenorhabditis briggsae TaxID=6238 RepID=A0AAE9EEG9_CAEBR|nr:hypothetical protein L5515_003298 [Caenorhabditis briggsae]